MKRGPNITLWSCCFGLALAAMATIGAASAAAAPAGFAAQRAASAESDPAAQSDCTAGQSQQWDLNGANEVDVAYDGSTFVYSVTVTQNGSCLSGTLDDPYYPTSGPISGTVSGDSITFTFSYPSGSIQGTRTYTGTISQSGVASGTWTQTGDESPDNGTWTLADKATTPTPSECTKPYEQPASWDTARVASATPGIADYIEPLNVIISACSNVPLSDIRAALGDWDTVSSRWVDLGGAHFKCISPEEADVTGAGYVTQQQSWRYEGCGEGNVLSLTGLENHVRIWNQAVPGSTYGAWFITASYETACVSINGKLYSFFDEGSHFASGMHFFHCVDGGPGSFDTDGYDRGAKDFAHEVALATGQQGWKVTEETITRPLTRGNVGEDGVPFDGTVYVLTITR